MKAEALAQERHVLAENAFVEIVIWRVPHPVKGSTHRFKYRLALIVAGRCVLRYDNESGKGDHRHIGEFKRSYSFSSYERLLADFWADVDAWRQRDEDCDAGSRFPQRRNAPGTRGVQR
jgi:hypothetical protein